MSIKTTKKTPEPILLTKTLSKVVEPLMQAFHVSSEKEARTLVKIAATAIYGQETTYDSDKESSKAEFNFVCSLMRNLKPTNALESLLCSQIVIGHLLGIQNISRCNPNDKRFGLRLLKFSTEVSTFLLKNRSVSKQNISVFHHIAKPPKLEEVTFE